MYLIHINDLKKLDHQRLVYFTLFCAKQVEHLLEIEEGKDCLKTVEKWLAGEETTSECLCASFMANAAARNFGINGSSSVRAANMAVYAAAYPDEAANWAARAVRVVDIYGVKNRQQMIKAQWAYYDELLNADKYLEKILLNA